MASNSSLGRANSCSHRLAPRVVIPAVVVDHAILGRPTASFMSKIGGSQRLRLINHPDGRRLACVCLDCNIPFVPRREQNLWTPQGRQALDSLAIPGLSKLFSDAMNFEPGDRWTYSSGLFIVMSAAVLAGDFIVAFRGSLFAWKSRG